MPVFEAGMTSSRIGTAPDQRLVSAFRAFLGVTHILGKCPEYTHCLSAQFLVANIEFVFRTLPDLG